MADVAVPVLVDAPGDAAAPLNFSGGVSMLVPRQIDSRWVEQQPQPSTGGGAGEGAQAGWMTVRGLIGSIHLRNSMETAPDSFGGR